MTDTQLLTLALSVIIPVSVMIYSNSRVSDLQKALDARFKGLEEKIDNAFEHLELLLRLHEAEHHRNG